MSECTHDCGSCSANCSERKQESLVAQPHKDSHIKKVIGVVSGKGGVGKSMVTSMSAVLMNRRGYRSAVLDADITGPSIPQAFGLHEKAQGNETEIFPVTTETGIKVMSVNLLLPDETDPVIWRGPIIAGTAKQFWTDVAWGDCPDCGKHMNVFGLSHIDETAQKFGLKVLAKLPINPELAGRVDNGTIEGFTCPEAEPIADAAEEFCK